MKAISVKQPWADLIIQGKKTIDLRTRRWNYRGPVAIHASLAVEEDACKEMGLDPEQMTAGAVIGIVNLVGVSELDQVSYDAKADQHLGRWPYKEGLFAWEFSNPIPLESPLIYKGQHRIFSVPDELIASHMKNSDQPAPKPKLSSTWRPDLPFELRVVSEVKSGSVKTPYRLALYQPEVKDPGQQTSYYDHNPRQLVKVVELSGQPLQAVADHVLSALRDNSYKPTDLSPKRKDPFHLDEESGVKLGLLFLAVKPITKIERIEDISNGLRMMTSEELYYWFSKCTMPPAPERAQKALRVLLAEE